MNRSRKAHSQAGQALLALLALLLLTSTAGAQSGGPYDLSWSTVDGGGAIPSLSAGGDYVLGGTVGQPDAGLLVGGPYTLGGGFWFGALGGEYRFYLPLVMRGY